MGQTQYFKSYIRWNTGSDYVYVPSLPNAVLSCPQSFIVPPVIGAVAKINYCRGLRVPVLDVNVVHLDGGYPVGAIGPLTAQFLTYLFDRVTLYLDSQVFGDGLTTGVEYWDGNSGFTLLGAKFESMRITVSKASGLTLACRFVGAGLAVITDPVSVPVWTNSTPLNFQAATFGSPIAGVPWAADLIYTNNHRPIRQIINGTSFPFSMIAGAPTATLNLITQTADGSLVPTSGLSLTLSGNSGAASIQLTNCLNNTLDNRKISIPRNMRDHSIMTVGNQGDISSVFYISSF